MTFTGGTGNDHFRLATGNGTETITDFSDGQNRIDLLGTLSFNKLTIVQSTTEISDTLIKLTSSNTTLAVLQNVQASSITGADFALILLFRGSARLDSLIARASDRR